MLTVGQFKDDQLQTHIHYVESTDGYKYYPAQYTSGSGAYTIGISGTPQPILANTIKTGRNGATTHGKSKGVKYIIKVL